jgi:NhaA family Na+:H+ antiporter
MSIFVTLLAFDDPTIVSNSKLAILIASSTAAILGFITLKRTLKPQK